MLDCYVVVWIETNRETEEGRVGGGGVIIKIKILLNANHNCDKHYLGLFLFYCYLFFYISIFLSNLQFFV
jgi:hypothetical protein